MTVAAFTSLHTVTPVLPLSSIVFWELSTTFDASKGVDDILSPVGVWVDDSLLISERPIN